MLMSPRKNVISFQLCSASSGQYAHPIAKPILMRLCILNPTACTKVQKKYISYAEPLGSIASHVAYPQKQSRFFFSTSFFFSLFPPTFLAFSPVNPWYHWASLQKNQGNFPEVLFVQQRQTFPLIYKTIKSLLNKKKGKNVDNFLTTSVYAT